MTMAMTTPEPTAAPPQTPETAAIDRTAEAPLPSPAPAVEEPAAAVPSVADGVEHPLDPRVVRLDRIVGWIVTGSISLGLFVGFGIVLLTVPLGWVKALVGLVAAAVIVALGWSSHRWPEIEYRHAYYKVDAQGIEIRKGVVWRTVTNVPRSRVQHTDVSQGPLERSHGLGTLVIYTAGTDHARVDLHGLDHGTALRIRDHLLPREGDDAV
jgi:uncharacterized protein